jgi:hypothetical protein
MRWMGRVVGVVGRRGRVGRWGGLGSDSGWVGGGIGRRLDGDWRRDQVIHYGVQYTAMHRGGLYAVSMWSLNGAETEKEKGETEIGFAQVFIQSPLRTSTHTPTIQ